MVFLAVLRTLQDDMKIFDAADRRQFFHFVHREAKRGEQIFGLGLSERIALGPRFDEAAGAARIAVIGSGRHERLQRSAMAACLLVMHLIFLQELL